MKKITQLLICALVVLIATNTRSVAQHISSSRDFGYCALVTDSMDITETGYTGADTIILYNGDGTSDTYLPWYSSAGTAYYGASHYYGTPGTYSKKIVLIAGGSRVDSVTSTYIKDPCEMLSMIFYSDNNSNCTFDAGDTRLYASPATIRVDSAGTPVDTITSNWGAYYVAHGAVGTVYTFNVIHNPSGFLPTCPSSGSVSFTIASTYGFQTDSLGFACDPTACLDNGVWGSFMAAVTGARTYMFVTTSSCTPLTLNPTLTFSPKYTVSAVYGPSYSISGNVITFTTTVSATAPQFMAVHFSPVGTLTLGDTIHTGFAVNGTGDCDLSNNSVFTIDTIRASLDPNHKSVQPNGAVTPGSQLEYMLQFENTGNAPATNISLMDTLSDNLDINTIRQIASSAACKMILAKWGTHNIVRFDFANINLPDSSHHGLCDGFVSFTIQSKSTLSPGTTIDNRAGIYFDINPVVMTNTVENTIPVTTYVPMPGSNVEIYPNPVNDVLVVVADQASYKSMTVTNTLGQAVMTRTVATGQSRIDVRSLPAGVYYLQLKGDNGTKVMKFVKM
jgi:uncharacterized repeat protein (TIGR01451 family)